VTAKETQTTPGLIVPPRKTAGLDLLSLGAMVHRLDPGTIPFRKTRAFDVWVSGGEYNVAANLSDCFGMQTGIASAMVDYPIGHLVANAVRGMGVKGVFKTFAHDGVTGPNIAAVYSDRGQGVRAPVVFYNRANEAAALLKPGDFDWQKIFADGVRWFHSGGIFAALSETTAELIIEAMREAKAQGAVVSFDLNYRAKLWQRLGGRQAAQRVLRQIAALADVIVGNEEDLQLGLGIQGPQVEKVNSGLDPAVFFTMIGNVTAEFPNVRAVATTLREVVSTNRHRWGAVLWAEGETYTSPTIELDVLCRIGGGDGFASGLFYGLLNGLPPAEALNLGWAHGALLTSTPGDTTMVTLPEVLALAKGGSARVQR
jgi:2-dehydro-3-deoxygluconokinase